MAESNSVPIIVKTYSSNVAISYIVVRVVNGEECVINTDIKFLNRQQQKQSALQLEFAALKFAVDANSELLSQNDYEVEVDSLPLMSMLSLPN